MSDARRGLCLLSNYSQHAVKGGCIKIVEQHCAIILHVLRETSFQARINSAYCPKRFFTALPSFAAVFKIRCSYCQFTHGDCSPLFLHRRA